MIFLISPCNSGLTRSSASMMRIQSAVACSMPKFFCGPYPGHGRTKTLSVNRRASSTVRSVLHASTTTISSAHCKVSRQARIFASSFLVIVTVAIVALFIAISSNEHASMSILPKDCLAAWENLAETEETIGSEQVVATRQERLPHSFKTTGLSGLSTIDLAFPDLEQ